MRERRNPLWFGGCTMGVFKVRSRHCRFSDSSRFDDRHRATQSDDIAVEGAGHLGLWNLRPLQIPASSRTAHVDPARSHPWEHPDPPSQLLGSIWRDRASHRECQEKRLASPLNTVGGRVHHGQSEPPLSHQRWTDGSPAPSMKKFRRAAPLVARGGCAPHKAALPLLPWVGGWREPP